MASFEVIVLGVGDVFSEINHPSSLLLHCDGFYLAIDCPDTYRSVLHGASSSAGRAIDVASIDHVLITHVHGDHMNGLEGFAFYKHFVEGKHLSLYTTPEVRSVIWGERLRVSMGKLWDGERHRTMEFDDYFDYHPLDWTHKVAIGPFAVSIHPTVHHVPTIGLLVECMGRRLGYSSDTAFDPQLISFLSAADLIIHETNYGPAHTALFDLESLPDHLQKNMRLIHVPDELASVATSIRTLHEGEVLRV
ncbi:MAG: MBL fold metallo-hydrolase [Acidobacteriota bacterium]